MYSKHRITKELPPSLSDMYAYMILRLMVLDPPCRSLTLLPTLFPQLHGPIDGSLEADLEPLSPSLSELPLAPQGLSLVRPLGSCHPLEAVAGGQLVDQVESGGGGGSGVDVDDAANRRAQADVFHLVEGEFLLEVLQLKG